MKKIIVLGSLGMAGHIMIEVLKNTKRYQVYGVARQIGKNVDMILDVKNFNSLEIYLNKIQPDYIINCIGVLVSQSQNDLPSAVLLNSYLPNFLSQLGNKLNYKLVHISTDCVFSGKNGQYTEISYRDGEDNYARTKALGEIVNNKDLTIRTSIIGPELKVDGTGLLDWFLKQNQPINGYTKAYWSGVTTLELAKATISFLEQDIKGLYHLCPSEKISKYELLKLFSKIWSKKIEILPFEDYNIDKSLLCTREDFSYPLPIFEKMLQELKVWMVQHSDNYNY